MKTILVLEDDLRNMQVFCAILNSTGYRVLEATTGKEAIEISNKYYEPISLFVSDLSLPTPRPALAQSLDTPASTGWLRPPVQCRDFFPVRTKII